MNDADGSVEALQRQLLALERRLDRLERRLGLGPRRTRAAVDTSPLVSEPIPPAPAPAPVPARREDEGTERNLAARSSRWTAPNIEDLLGLRLFALVGGAAFLLGVAFFVALAVERGWIGETTRVVLAFLASSCVLGAGVWLYERHGQLQATLAMVGAGLAGLYLTLTAASALYSLIPEAAAMVAALAIGALAAGIAIRRDSRTVAGLGIVGTLLAPTLADSLTTAGIGFLAVASASACAVTIWRRWDWLTIVAFVVAMPQVAVWAFGSPSSAALVAMLGSFAALNLATSLGFELRVPTAGLRPSSSLLVLFSALVVASLGYIQLPHGEGELAGSVWIAALALGHAALGVGALRTPRVNDEIAFLLLGVALTLGDLAFALLADGVVLAVGWAASAALLAATARRLGRRGELVSLTLGAQLALAIAHTLLFDAPPGAVAGGSADTASAASALAAILVAAFASARLTGKESAARRAALDALSMGALAYLSALMLDGVPLVLAWAFEAAALAEAAGRLRDRVAAIGALGFLALAAAHVLSTEAPPEALLYGADDLAAAAIGLAVVAATLLQLLRSGVASEAQERTALAALATAALVYLCSIAIVTPFQPGPDAPDTGLTLGVRQQGQLLLSVFWGACGFAGLWAGLRGNRRPLRLAGFALLSLTVGKVFLYDLATLASIYRVASLVALGLLLLTAAFAYQRLRAVQ